MRAARRVRPLVVLLVIVVGTGLVSVCLPQEFDNPAYYDGDGDDGGALWKPAIPWSDILVPEIGQPLVPRSFRLEGSRDLALGAHQTPQSRPDSRAPPA